MEDSPGLDVLALFGGRNLLAGRGCGGDGEVGPTRVSYQRGEREAEGTGARDTVVVVEEGVECPAAGGGMATAAVAG